MSTVLLKLYNTKFSPNIYKCFVPVVNNRKLCPTGIAIHLRQSFIKTKYEQVTFSVTTNFFKKLLQLTESVYDFK